MLQRVVVGLRVKLSQLMERQPLGPIQARVLYDVSVGLVGVTVAAAYGRHFLAESPRWVWMIVAMPLLFVGFNGALGVYSRLRTSRPKFKSVAILGSVVLAATTDLLIGGPLPHVVLWGILVFPPAALARLLLWLPYSRHKHLVSIAVNRHGPVLVIGGAGYIGSHVVAQLLQSGQPVRILDRLMYGRGPMQEFLSDRDCELIEGDATEIAKLTQAMNGAAAVVHLAGLVGDPACAIDAEFTRHANIIATRMAAEVAHSSGVERFVFASSCSVYGVSDKEVCETDELHPVSLYAQTKIDSERGLLASQQDDFFVTILRFATVFGHSRRPRFDLVGNLFTAQAMTDGLITVTGPDQWRPFVHVRDLARAICKVLFSDPATIRGQIFNVGDKRLNMTIKQLAENVQSVCRRYRDVRISVSDNPKDRRNYAVSFRKIESELGFHAMTLIPEGVAEMANALHNGKYLHYRDHVYSNVAMTTKAVSRFHDPEELAHLYAPMNPTSAWLGQ